jgi:conjugative relaxase-like TrwC/TraI family protein
MISISKPQSAEQAQSYYKKENYYQKNSEEGYYYGEALKHLGIKKGEEVTKENYALLLKGFHPIKKTPLLKNSGEKDRRAGFDVTFSAPKSVSLLLELYEGYNKDEEAKKLREAHEKATLKAMELIEKEFAKTRIYDENGNRIKVNANIAFATFQHDTSRMLDPQLHNHNFIFNLVTYKDPITNEVKFASLSNEDIYRAKMLLGLYYRNELANNLRELGYELKITDKKQAFFEIKNAFNDKELEHFSNMSKMLEEAYEQELKEYQKRYPNANIERLKEYIKLEKRRAKQKVDRDEVREINIQRAKILGIDEERLNKILALKKEKHTEIDKDETAQKHLKIVLTDLTKTKSYFTEYEILKEALKLGTIEGLRLEDYKRNLNKIDELIKLDDKKKLYTTKEMINTDKSIIKHLQEGFNATKALASKEEVEDFINKNYKTLTQGQKDFVINALITQDRYLAVQGDAGAGKTYAVKVIHDFLRQKYKSFNIKGASFTGKASEGLEKDSGIKSYTLHKYILDYEKEKKEKGGKVDKTNGVLIIDEAGMVGSRQFLKIMQIAKERNDKVFFIGDTKQFEAIEAGSPFYDIQRFGAKTIEMSEVLRQKDELAKEVVSNIKEKKLEEAISLLEQKSKIKEDTKENLIENIANEYVSKKENERDKTLIIASTNKDKNELNKTIREKLNKKGKEYNTKENVTLQGIQARYADNYKIGDEIILNKVKGFKAGQKGKIIGYKDDKTLLIEIEKKKKGKTYTETAELNVFENADNISVFRDAKKRFEAGDKIIFTKNIERKELKVKNGELDEIEEIDEEGNIRTKKGKKFNINDMPYVDYGYAITDVKSQGMTADNVIILADSKMANYNSFYTQITRTKYNISLYTQNLEELKANIKRENKESLLELLEKQQNNKEAKNERITGNKKTTKRDERELGGDKITTGETDGKANRARKTNLQPLFNIRQNVTGSGRRVKKIIKALRKKINIVNELKKRLGKVLHTDNRMQQEQERTGMILSYNTYTKKDYPVDYWKTRKLKNKTELETLIKNYPYSPFVFKNGYRKGENTQELTALILDFDNDNKDYIISMEQVLNKLKQAGIKALAVETKSSGKEKGGIVAERFRVIIPIENHIPINKENREEYARAVELFTKELGLYDYLDKGALRDIARMYRPSPLGAKATAINGKAVDFNEYMEQAKKVILREKEEQERQRQERLKRLQSIEDNISSYTYETGTEENLAGLTYADTSKILSIPFENLINHFETIEKEEKEGSYKYLITPNAKYSILKNGEVMHDFKSGKTYNKISYLYEKLGVNNLMSLARELEKITGESYIKINENLVKNAIKKATEQATDLYEFNDIVKRECNVEFCRVDIKNNIIKIADIEFQVDTKKILDKINENKAEKEAQQQAYKPKRSFGM